MTQSLHHGGGIHTTPLTVRGWTLDDLRARAEHGRSDEVVCSRTVCYAPEVKELSEFVLALLDKVETLTWDGVLRGK